jgi:hypothetical protein
VIYGGEWVGASGAGKVSDNRYVEGYRGYTTASPMRSFTDISTPLTTVKTSMARYSGQCAIAPVQGRA